MPKFRKPPRNSYYCYMVERRKELEAQGVRFKFGMDEVARAVAEDWKLMTKEQKKKYEEMAKELNKQEKHNLNNKFTCSGESYASLVKRMEQEQSEIAKQTQYLESLVRSQEDPTSQLYVAMHAIPSCAVEVKASAEKDIWPLEFCIAAFSLRHGLISHFWSLIDTVKVPTGYMSEAKDTAAETLLPIPGSKKFKEEARSAATDYLMIFWKIRRFVEQFCSGYSGKYVIFGMEENLQAMRGTIKWLVDNVGGNRQNNFEFLDKITFMRLPNLVLSVSVLAKEIHPDYETELTQLQLVDSAISLLNWSHFDYRNEVTCLYHIMEEHCERMQICCSNYILRRIFIILQEIGIGGFRVESTERHALETFRKPTQSLPMELVDKLSAIDEPPSEAEKREPTEEEIAKMEEGMYHRDRKMFKRRADEANSVKDEWTGVNKKARLGPNGTVVSAYSIDVALPGHNSVFTEVSLGCSVPSDIITVEDEEAAPEKYKLEDFPQLPNDRVRPGRGRGVRRIVREDEVENRFPGEVKVNDDDSGGPGGRRFSHNDVREPQGNSWDHYEQDSHSCRGRGCGRQQEDFGYQYDGCPGYQLQGSGWAPRNTGGRNGQQEEQLYGRGHRRSSKNGKAENGDEQISSSRGNWRGGRSGNLRHFTEN